MNLFPVHPSTAQTEVGTAQELPLCKEVAWDFQEDKPIFHRGKPVVAEGLEAVRVWLYHALRAARGRYPIYTGEYGHEMEELVGQPFSEAVKRSEAARYVREAVAVNPYVEDVTEVTVGFDDDRLNIDATIKTVYGEVTASA